jgi:two-component system chemotaxis response regulator CheY
MGFQVLIVEDNEPAINMMVDMLLPMQITNITKASHGKSALTKTQFQKFDLIICDLNMPLMGGLEFFLDAKQSEFIKNTPFLMVSAENEKDKIVKALGSGINDYLVKPFSQEMFSSKVKKLLKISSEIHWDESLALGNEKIDNDHKYLINLVNTISLAMECNVSHDDLLTQISPLETQCKIHFQREEDIMVKIKFPSLNSHRSEHHGLLNHLRNLYEDVQSKASMEDCKKSIPLVELLGSWIIRDIKNQDGLIKDFYIESNSSGFNSI